MEFQALKTFNRVNVRKEFENYGNIESVKLLDNGRPEAYVTFADDKSAAMAFGLMNCENDLKITEREYLCFKKYDVQIANTWHQPPDFSNNKFAIDSTTSSVDSTVPLPAIFNLNEDCLRHVFTFCDLESLIHLSQVCKLFNELLCVNGSTTFRRFTTLRLVVDVIEKDRFGKLMTLGKARKLLRHVGPFVRTLIVRKLDAANVQRYFEKIDQYVGENVRCMEIYDINLNENLTTILRSVFHRLSELKIRLFNNTHEIDFQALCPNLTKLKILGIVNIEQSCKNWSNLQHISLLSDVIPSETFNTFVSLNSHLKSIKFFYQNFQQIQSISSNLLTVEKLEVNCKYKLIPPTQLRHLHQLTLLCQLNLWNLTGQASLVDILLVLAKFTRLRTLKLHVSDDQNSGPSDSTVQELIGQTVLALAYELIHLEKLMLFNIKLLESTVYDIIRIASQLTIFHIHSADTQWSGSFATAIVNIRKGGLLQDQTLQMFLDENFSFATNKDDQKYLRIFCDNWRCNHSKTKTFKR